MKIYVYAAILVAVIAILGWGYSSAYRSGKQSIVTKLQEDKIQVLKDGKKVDENVLSADDDSLVCLLLDNCEPDKPL